MDWKRVSSACANSLESADHRAPPPCSGAGGLHGPGFPNHLQTYYECHWAGHGCGRCPPMRSHAGTIWCGSTTTSAPATSLTTVCAQSPCSASAGWLLGWHAAAMRSAARDRWIGDVRAAAAASVPSGQSVPLPAVERGRPRPLLTSRVLGFTLRQLPRVWQRRHG